MICSVCYKWLDNGDWSSTYTFYINVRDGDIERAAKVVAKQFGKLKGSYNLEDDKIDFRVDDGEVLYWICIRPLEIEDV